MKYKYGQKIEYRYDVDLKWYKGKFISYDEGLFVIKSDTSGRYISFGESNTREPKNNNAREQAVTEMINIVTSDAMWQTPTRCDMGILYDNGYRQVKL